ncbi:MAG: tetratricopeptide repeat protein [Anaerolineae bacterium]
MAEQSLGHWLKERRKALKLTQAELARLIGYSEVYVRKIEADERLPTPDTLEKFAVYLCQPREQAVFLRVARGELGPDELPDPTLSVPRWPAEPEIQYPSSLPAPLTSLIDREADVLAVRERLARPGVRLLTLVGPPGIGKTRLALEVARQFAPAFDNNVYFVGLSATMEPEGVAPAIARVMGIRNGANGGLIESLKAALSQKSTLLVLDNFEQVTLAAPLVQELLESTPTAKALLTSRTPLHLQGEHEFLVAPLGCPPLPLIPRIESDDIAGFPSVALFLNRAQAVQPRFKLAPSNAEAVAAICARLEGVPLAIELAAAHVKSLTPQAILDRLQPYMSRLVAPGRAAPSRHRTMRDAIDWSYDLLEEPERAMFARLSVFAGGFTLEAVEAVVAPSVEHDSRPFVGDTLGAISALVDKNFLQHEEGTDGQGRYRMLEMIREYALERLAERGQIDAMRDYHAAYYLGLAETIPVCDPLAAERHISRRLIEEQRNLEAALVWALDRRSADVALRLCVALWPVWLSHGQLHEGHAWLGTSLAQADGTSAPATVAGALLGAGLLASAQGYYNEAAECLSRSLALWSELGDVRQVAATLRSLGVVAAIVGDFDAARARFGRALDLSRPLDDIEGIAEALNFLGQVQLDLGDIEGARRSLVEALPLVQRPELRHDRILVLRNLGRVAAASGDFAVASRYFDEALAIAEPAGDVINITKLNINLAETMLRHGEIAAAHARLKTALDLAARLGDRRGIMRSLEGLAAWAAARDMPLMQARLLGAAGRLREAMGLSRIPTAYSLLAEQTKVGDDMDDTRRVAAEEGRAWSITEAVAAAMSL